MYVDPDIKLPKMPRWLYKSVMELQEKYDTGDTFGFDLLEEAVCADVKQAELDRQISAKDLDTIFKHFGWRV